MAWVGWVKFRNSNICPIAPNFITNWTIIQSISNWKIISKKSENQAIVVHRKWICIGNYTIIFYYGVFFMHAYSLASNVLVKEKLIFF